MHGHICISRHSPHPCHPHGGRRHWHAGRHEAAAGIGHARKTVPTQQPYGHGGAIGRTVRIAGVRPTDKPDEGERPKRDRPRLAFRPFHALMAILTLSCALCASLTMLVQQTIHYSELQHSRSQIRSQAQQQPQQAPQTEQTPAPQENGPTQDASTPDSHDGQDGAQQSNQLDLNTADLGELQTLKGVGPVTAQRILDYRTQIGRFDNVDQLLEVKGIGSKTLAKFRDQVCVR